jgi:hypothetical protein
VSAGHDRAARKAWQYRTALCTLTPGTCTDHEFRKPFPKGLTNIGASFGQPRWPGSLRRVIAADTLTVLPLCYRYVMAVRRKRSISIPPDLDAEIAAAARAAGVSYSAWLAQTAQKEFIIRAGLEAVSRYEAEHGPFTPDEIAEADEWAARVTQPPGTRRSA